MDQKKTMAKPLLKVKGLKKYFPIRKGIFQKSGYVKAVDGLDFYVKKGETLGIVGESGCGKSTTGQLILRLIAPTEGQIWFEDQELSQMKHRKLRHIRRDLQMIFQDPFASLNPRMTIKRTVAEPLKIHGLTKSETQLKERVAELLEIVGLDTHHMSRYPHEFSGGQRQRIGIARALALNPKLIVCDEPVSALDVSIQSQILNLLKSLQKKFSLTYIFIAHSLPAIKHISDRVAVMYLGKIVELADRDDLFHRPRHPYTEALISAIPIPDPLKQKRELF